MNHIYTEPHTEIRHIYTEHHWRITWITDVERFFKALRLIVPYGAILYFEGHKAATSLSRVLQKHRSVRSPRKIAGKRPLLSQHVIFTQEFVDDFVRFLFDSPRRNRFDHVHCYANDKMLFWFHDALSGGDLVVSRDVKEENISAFCRELGPQYLYEGAIV